MSEHYLHEYDIITQGQRNKQYVDGQHWRCRVHLVPFFGNLGISEITAGKIQFVKLMRGSVSMMGLRIPSMSGYV